MSQKKLREEQLQAGKVGGAKKKQLEEDFVTNQVTWQQSEI